MKNSLSDIGSFRYERNRFERRPFGGSLVIFTPRTKQTIQNINSEHTDTKIQSETVYKGICSQSSDDYTR